LVCDVLLNLAILVAAAHLICELTLPSASIPGHRRRKHCRALRRRRGLPGCTRHLPRGVATLARHAQPQAEGLLPVGADRHRHCGRCALTMPSTWMTPPSVIMPRSAKELKRAKQLSGIASASTKSRFMAKCVCLCLRRQPNSRPSVFAANRILSRLDVRTTLSKKFNDRNRSPGSGPVAGTEQLLRPSLLIEFKPFAVV
jgi:hypothetical protein